MLRKINARSGLILFLGIASAVAATGPLALWRGDGDATDSVGTSDGTLLNGTGFEAGIVPGFGGQAFSFDGSDDEVEFPAPAAGVFDAGVSISAWIATSATADFSGILTKFSQAGNKITGFQVSMSGFNGFPPNQSGTLRSDLGTGQSYATAFNPRLVMDGMSHHFALTCDGQTACLYVDGESGDPVGFSGWARDNDVKFVLGNDRGSGGRHFHGRIDEVAIYPRALSPFEVRGLAGRIQLQIVAGAPGLATVTWSAGIEGYHLETSDAPGPDTWSAVSDGTTSPVIVSTLDTARFYRLAKP